MLLKGAPDMLKPTRPGSSSSPLRTPAHRKVKPSFQAYRSLQGEELLGAQILREVEPGGHVGGGGSSAR